MGRAAFGFELGAVKRECGSHFYNLFDSLLRMFCCCSGMNHWKVTRRRCLAEDEKEVVKFYENENI